VEGGDKASMFYLEGHDVKKMAMHCRLMGYFAEGSLMKTYSLVLSPNLTISSVCIS
jgi:hypothetical protein